MFFQNFYLLSKVTRICQSRALHLFSNSSSSIVVRNGTRRVNRIYFLGERLSLVPSIISTCVSFLTVSLGLAALNQIAKYGLVPVWIGSLISFSVLPRTYQEKYNSIMQRGWCQVILFRKMQKMVTERIINFALFVYGDWNFQLFRL